MPDRLPPAKPPLRCTLLSRRAALQLAILVGGGLTRNSDAAGLELRVVTGDNGESTRQILDVIGRRLPGFQFGADARALAQRAGPGFYVALGPAALQSTLDVDLGSAPLLSLFTSNEAYTRLVGTAQRRPRASVSAVFAEAAPQNQMALIRSLYTRRVGVGVLLTESTANQEPALRRAARVNELEIEVWIVRPSENVIRALTHISSAAALLAIPDRDLYTADNLRNVLESTYRRNQAVIGFSASLVAAGTLAAAYSTIDDTIAHLAEIIAGASVGRLPPPQYPFYWRVAINDTVARSLNVVVTDATRALGNPPPPP